MMAVRAACFPPSDRRFARSVEQVMGATNGDLSSPEGIALVQATLRKSYPVAVLHPGETAIEAHRDGSGPADESIASWLSAVYERHSVAAYTLSLRVVGDPALAERAVELAFSEIARVTPTSVAVEAIEPTIQAAVCRFALAALRSSVTR